MWEAVALLGIVAAVVIWVDSLRARERAVEAGRQACARYGLQFLDDTVAFSRLVLARDEDGRLRCLRLYVFEFSDDGNNRRHGSVAMRGAIPEDIRLEPYRMQ